MLIYDLTNAGWTQILEYITSPIYLNIVQCIYIHEYINIFFIVYEKLRKLCCEFLICNQMLFSYARVKSKFDDKLEPVILNKFYFILLSILALFYFHAL